MSLPGTVALTRLPEAEWQHVLDVADSTWPALSVSAALRLIVKEHLLLTGAGILGRYGSERQRLQSNRPLGPKKAHSGAKVAAKLCTQMRGA